MLGLRAYVRACVHACVHACMPQWPSLPLVLVSDLVFTVAVGSTNRMADVGTQQVKFLAVTSARVGFSARIWCSFLVVSCLNETAFVCSHKLVNIDRFCTCYQCSVARKFTN